MQKNAFARHVVILFRSRTGKCWLTRVKLQTDFLKSDLDTAWYHGVIENCYFRLPIKLLLFYFKMKLLSTFFVIFLSVAASNNAGSMRKIARCSDIANLTVSFLAAPPYVILDGVKNCPTGALSNFVKSILQKCFHQWKCGHDLSNVTWQRIVSAEDLYQIVQTERTDIAFAFPPSLSLPKPHILYRATFTEIIKSPGLALVVDKTNCRNAAKQSMWKNIISYWPIFLFMFVLSWIFGILMWILVSWFKVYVTGPAEHRGAEQRKRKSWIICIS